MVHSYTLPTLADLDRLAQPHDIAVTIYVATSPVVSERDLAFTTAKSAVDEALRTVRADGARHATEASLRAQWEQIAADEELWGNLASSLAIFITPEHHEVFVLPNALENQRQVARYFDLGQIVRSVASNQHAYALTLSANEWNLWEATPSARANKLDLTLDHPKDAAEATNRDDIGGRKHARRLVGDEGKNVLLEQYAERVAEAVDAELRRVDPDSKAVLFVFANEPLLAMYTAVERREVVEVRGASDELRPDQIDDAVREQLPILNAAKVSSQLDRIGNDIPNGLVSTDLEVIARAAAQGAIDTLIYEFTVDVLGTYDETSGALTVNSSESDEFESYDLLSRIAVAVHRTGGEVIPVRDHEVTAEAWNGVAVAHLRFVVE